MRQETGSNPQNSNKSVSIRILSNGHILSLPQIENEGRDTTIEILSHQTVLAPTHLLDSTSPEQIARECGTVIENSQSILTINNGEMTALIAAPTIVVNQLKEQLPYATLTTPLLSVRANDSSHIWVQHIEGLLYIKLYDQQKLTFAEVFKAPTQTDVIYWLNRISDASGNSGTLISLFRCEKSLQKLLKRYFRYVVQCE